MKVIESIRETQEFTYLVATTMGVQTFTTDQKMMEDEDGEVWILKNDTEELILSKNHVIFIRKMSLDDDDAEPDLENWKPEGMAQ